VKVTNNGKEEEKDGFEQFEAALQAYVKGDAAPLAKLAPTSLVFGHWDSRDSATKKSTKRGRSSTVPARRRRPTPHTQGSSG
jgi:hypothetical protein